MRKMSNLYFIIIRYDPPERKDQAKARLASPWASDIWGLGCLIWEVIPFLGGDLWCIFFIFRCTMAASQQWTNLVGWEISLQPSSHPTRFSSPQFYHIRFYIVSSAEVNISPENQYFCTPPKMALHGNPVTPCHWTVLFLHEAQKRQFFCTL